jgi:hypothetical protein
MTLFSGFGIESVSQITTLRVWPGAVGEYLVVSKEDILMTVVLPFLLKKGGAMKAESKIERNEEPKTRSIILPVYLWNVLDKDAKRCRRSATKQIEAILVRYYNLEANIELDEESIDSASQAVSHKRTKIA